MASTSKTPALMVGITTEEANFLAESFRVMIVPIACKFSIFLTFFFTMNY